MPVQWPAREQRNGSCGGFGVVCCSVGALELAGFRVHSLTVAILQALLFIQEDQLSDAKEAIAAAHT